MPRSEAHKRTNGLTVRPLRTDDWPNIEVLFGKNGACGGCWCMWWRVPRGGKLWDESKGAKNKRTFKKLISTGEVYGCLAFRDSEPVGWCCVGPRSDFPRLERTKALRSNWDEHTWSVTCFYIRTPWRRRGVATALLNEAVKVARANGARELEAYPVHPKADRYGEMIPVFAWTGVPRIFEKHKFRNVTPPANSRDIYRKTFRPRRDRPIPRRDRKGVGTCSELSRRAGIRERPDEPRPLYSEPRPSGSGHILRTIPAP